MARFHPKTSMRRPPTAARFVRSTALAALTALACARLERPSGTSLAAAASPARLAGKRAQALAAASCPVTPSGKSFAGQDLTNHNFRADPPGSLRGASFEGAKLRGAIFAGQDLTGASFKGADLGPSDKGRVDFTSAVLEKTCFIGATMNDTDFTFARIKCADFSATSLVKADFGPAQQILADPSCRTRFAGATLDVRAIATEHWGKADFTDANLLNMEGFSLKGRDLHGAVLAGTNFTGIDMTGADLSGVDFSRATLVKARMDDAALNGIILADGANLRSASLRCGRFYGSKADDKDNPNRAACPSTRDSGAPNVAATLRQAVLQNADLTNATLSSAVLTGANLSGATLRSASFVNATLEPQGTILAASVLGADLTGARFSNAHVNHVAFNNVILTGANFDRTTLAGTDFTGSIMPGASFDHAVLEGVRFNATILQNAVFTSATLQTVPNGEGSGVTFTCAQLGGASFKDAAVTAADFQAAVMPAAADCCRQKVGDPFCGIVDSNQQVYGPVTFPDLKAVKVGCPNGDVAACAGSQWKIPGWQTQLCSADHSVQTVWSRPDCGSSPGDRVVFKDANLKRCILAALPDHPAEISVKTAATVSHVSCPGLGIKDLTGLEKFTGLVTLDLSGNQLRQFGLKLPALQTLLLSRNQLTTLDLSDASAVIRLEVSGNQLKAISGLADVSFAILDASHNALTSFDLPIQDSLVYADLSFNQLTGVLDQYNPDLGRLTQLIYLDLSHNSLPTVGSVEKISALADGGGAGSLRSLYLSCNPTFDCSSLGVDGTYLPLQTSQCADFNTQTEKWITRQHPKCTPSP